MLDRTKLSASVTGIAVRATRVSGREDKQGDLFDRGLVSSGATENALARLVEDQGNVLVVPVNSGHPLLEQRTVWEEGEGRSLKLEGRRANAANPKSQVSSLKSQVPSPKSQVSSLTLQLAPFPTQVAVETVARRDHMVPSRFRDARGWHEVVSAAGPDRVSGSAWDGKKAYAREYFRCVTREGLLVWLFRNARAERPASWYLHGWWD
jgi:hypothetical protein